MTCISDFLQNDHLLYFPPGEYHFYPEDCTQRYCHFSNNEEGLKTVAILLEDLHDFTVRGDNAKLIFHGRISPLCAFRCTNLTVSGLTIDFEDSFVSDADLIYRENGIAWFRFYGKHSFADHHLIFSGDVYDNMHKKLIFYCYDREKSEIKYDVRTISVPNRDLLYKDGLIGIKDCFASAGTDAFVVKHELRLCPGMVFDDCQNITLRNDTIHHAAGMGLLIQNSENCLVDGLVVAPSHRRASASDDALHITDCRGKIKIENCKLSGTLDDSINIHGVFRKLKSRIPGGKFYYLEAGHYQQQGVFNVHAGDTMVLFHRQTGKPYAKIHLTGVTPINKAFIKVDFDETQLPQEFTQGDPALILETMADLKISNTECRPLYGRSVLASGLNSIHISDCYFHSPGAGVFISGDFSFWYESGPVNNAVIENNTFDNCNYHQFFATREPLAVFPELSVLEENYYYHGSIKVKNNHFRAANRPLISVKSTTEAEIYGNSFTQEDSYEFNPHTGGGYSFTTACSPSASFLHCGKILEKDNSGFIK